MSKKWGGKGDENMAMATMVDGERSPLEKWLLIESLMEARQTLLLAL